MDQQFDVFRVLCRVFIIAGVLWVPLMLLLEKIGKRNPLLIEGTVGDPKTGMVVKAEDVVRFYAHPYSPRPIRGKVVNFYRIGEEVEAHIMHLDLQTSNPRISSVPLSEIEEILTEA